MRLIRDPFNAFRTLPAAQAGVLRTLNYFDIFQHPLKKDEIFQLIQDNSATENEVTEAIGELVSSGLIQHFNGYYFLHNKVEYVERRLDGELQAQQAMLKAKKYSKLISKFPFIRAVALSGSLSKNYMDRDSDIDYFIITAPGRMWLARTFLILYKKIFLLNSRKYFCVNYFLSADALEVPDKNIFTATEVSFLIPTYNHEVYLEFMQANAWSKNYLPHFPLRQQDHTVEKTSFVKNIMEKICSGAIGEKLDGYFFRLTLNFWKKKFSHFDASTFDFRLRSRKNVSKHHPQGYQEKVLKTYAEKQASFAQLHSISFHEDPVYA